MSEDGEPHYEILPGAAVFDLVRRVHIMGVIRGHQAAYADGARVIGAQIKKLEEELERRPRDSYLMGSIAALVQFADVLRQGHEAAGQEVDEYRQTIAEFCIDAGLENLLSVFMQIMSARQPAPKYDARH